MRPSEEHPPRILTAGYLTLDLITRDITCRDFWHSVGGTCGNVSVFASALGANVSLLGRTGIDYRGQILLKKVAAAGLDPSAVEQVPSLNTPGIVEIIRRTRDGGHRFTHKCPLCGVRLPKGAVISKRRAEVEAKRMSEFQAYFFDRATDATLFLARAARDAGLVVMFEPPSFPRTRRALYATELSDIVKISHSPSKPPLNWTLVQGGPARLVIETLGAGGVRFAHRSKLAWSRWKEIPSLSPVNIRDTAGAGDWLTAGLLTRLLPQANSHTIDPHMVVASIEYGQRLSAISISFDGPGGALQELGAAEIIRVANTSGPVSGFSTTQRIRSSQSNSLPKQSQYCEACLTEEVGESI